MLKGNTKRPIAEDRMISSRIHVIDWPLFWMGHNSLLKCELISATLQQMAIWLTVRMVVEICKVKINGCSLVEISICRMKVIMKWELSHNQSNTVLTFTHDHRSFKGSKTGSGLTRSLHSSNSLFSATSIPIKCMIGFSHVNQVARMSICHTDWVTTLQSYQLIRAKHFTFEIAVGII